MQLSIRATFCALGIGASLLSHVEIAASQQFIDPLHAASASMTGAVPNSRTPVIRGLPGDFWADLELGQRDFGEINERWVVPFKFKDPAGVAVDRSVYPGRLFVWDSGNNRIVSVDLNKCDGQRFCTADLALGQPDFVDWGACNRDSSFATYPLRAPASATTLCGVGEYTHTVLEDKSYSGLYVDRQGNLWVADVRNHRVLKYKTPSLTDATADDVWGQADFTGNLCNRQTIYYGPGKLPSPPSIPTASTLCFGEVGAGVTLDAAGNLWVADGGNNRVLRFPNVQGAIAKTADLVLGQPDFTSAGAGKALNQFNNPSQVRFDLSGNLLVLDSLDGESNSRVLRFRPPFFNGMSGEIFFGCPRIDPGNPNHCLAPPVAIEVDQRRNGIWIVVNEDEFNGRPLLYDFDGTLRNGLSSLGPAGLGNKVHGSIGIDGNGDLLMGTLVYGQNIMRVTEYAAGLFRAEPVFKPADGKTNLTTSKRFEHAAWGGVAVAGSQVIIADSRILFWNDRASLSNGQDPDGYVGGNSFNDVPDARAGQPEFGELKVDKDLRVWVTHTNEGAQNSEVRLYQAPLVTGAQPIKILHTLPVLGGGSITLTSAYGIAPTDHSEYLWISEPVRHRVIRVRGPLSNQPVVDVILGQMNYDGGEQCNLGVQAPSPVAANAYLCFPGAIALDRKGNLFVSDHFYELRGNHRLLMFEPIAPPPDFAAILRGASKAFPPDEQGRWHMTFEPAFDSQNRMVVGFNPYSGQRFLKFYSDPAAFNPSNPFDPSYARADGEFYDFYGWPVGMTFDADDNLYVYDANRKLLIYRKPLAAVRYITVLAPNGGERLDGDSTFSIRWSALPSVRAVNIEWQPFNTNTWLTIARNVPNTGSYQWIVPRLPGDQARVRITNAANAAQTDMSDAVFSVVYIFGWKVTPQLVCVNGGTPTHDATWTDVAYALFPPVPVFFNYAWGGQPLTVQSNASMSGVYLQMHTLDDFYETLTPVLTQAHPALVSGTYFSPSTPMIRWSSQNVSGFPPLPQGAYPVRFYAPPRWCPGTLAIQPLRPGAGETLLVGDNYPIRWLSGQEITHTVKIEYSINNGATWNLITPVTPNSGVYAWYVPGTPTAVARFRITSNGPVSASIISPPFTIKFR
jgi:hypothetical protein